MIDKRLMTLMGSSKKYIGLTVLFNWINLIANIVIIFILGNLLGVLFSKGSTYHLALSAAIIFLCVALRFFCTWIAAQMSGKASSGVKRTLREKIYQKLLSLGMRYNESVSTAEVVQISVEGVEQLDTYFGRYLPQLLYSLLAPLTLFSVLSFVSLKTAIVLLICVPLIPLSIVAVQNLAKRLLSKYWQTYAELGDDFLENLQGLTTLKIYEADAAKNDDMNKQAERFRKITMKVLAMQLNSVTVMDIIAYGGAALGIILTLSQLAAGSISLSSAFVLILLCAEFFIPLRLLGSFFHIAMNGMAASDKIFKLLDLPEAPSAEGVIDPLQTDIVFDHIHFSYDPNRSILKDLSLTVPHKGFTAIVGESGSGKSTIASLLMGIHKQQSGTITIGGQPHDAVSEASIMDNITLIRHNSTLFKGTVRDNLMMGNPQADDDAMITVLRKVQLYGFLFTQNGLDTKLIEQGSNLSGGQCQRLAIARALLHDSPIYIFDEATSNIDVESEEAIMAVIHELAKEKTTLLISHRMANVVPAHQIFVLRDGCIAETGTHNSLLSQNGLYTKLYTSQKELENYGKEHLDYV